MRQIKFRGKRVDNGEWVYGFYVKDPLGNHRIYYKPFEECTSNTYHFVDPATVGQFTGLLDKNGKEIWEGDWCTAMFRTREGIEVIQGYIFMDDYMWCIDCTGCNGDDIFSINSPHGFEVISNIHDSPSLTNQ